ncbi:TMEM43 family protein [Rhodanobacter sp. AS-Z3]|uniref:TMEM43 family protein n=1 Tax=Rhodanobacter sp. AS-Z3 TaxID=3031330 RepID=UPI00247A69BA|nr:TMEM43 family protein [Rhodanobacter sp. AS-Z3]WEN14636.1 TMEM43 family protein [Rhodanobacter sp. AS-Z3]
MDLHKGLSLPALALNVSGAVLMLAGIGLMATTASRLQNYRVAANLHGGEVIDLGEDARPAAGQHGAMARVVAVPHVVEAPQDPDFNLRANTSVLVRHVEMFQWREIKVGDSVHYELDWVDHLLDAGHFVDRKGHANPVGFPVSGKQFDAGLVQVGGFKLGPILLHGMPGTSRLTPDITALPDNLAASFTRYQNYLVTSAKPGDPRLGDVRVSWDEVPLQQMTFVGRIDGDRLVAATDAADGKGYVVQLGNVPVLDIFPDLPVPPEFVWTWRLLSVVLASLGAFALIAAKRGRGDPQLAAGLGAAAVGAVASVLWLHADTTVMGGWLAFVLAGLALVTWRLYRLR